MAWATATDALSNGASPNAYNALQNRAIEASAAEMEREREQLAWEIPEP